MHTIAAYWWEWLRLNKFEAQNMESKYWNENMYYNKKKCISIFKVKSKKIVNKSQRELKIKIHQDLVFVTESERKHWKALLQSKKIERKQRCILCQALNASIQCNFMSFWQRTRAKNEVIHSLSIVLNVEMVQLTAFSIAEEKKSKRARKKVTKNEITYLFMYFICTEKCELLHLATRTINAQRSSHTYKWLCLNVDRLFFLFFSSTWLLWVFVCFSFFSMKCVFCTISMYTKFPSPLRCRTFYGVMIYVPFARFVLCYKISK